MGKIRTHFYNKTVEKIIEAYIEHHLKRVKKKYRDKVNIRITHDVFKKGCFAFIQWDMINPKTKSLITFQIPILRDLVTQYMMNFVNDNVIDGIKHEFAHLKYTTEGKKHLKWMNQQKLFKIK